MKILRNGQAGTLESNDVLVLISPQPYGSGMKMELKSVVEVQFGEQIRNVVKETLKELGVSDVKVIIQDRGALDYCIRARVEAAVARASG
jgi:citrate lyase subunit gamma (acyl carrier protein)